MKYSILIVSNNNRYIETIKDALSSEKYSTDIDILISVSIEETLELLSKDIMSLLIIEEELETPQFIEQVKQKSLFLDKPIILIANSIQSTTKRYDITDFLIEPLHKEEVESVIINALDKHYEKDRIINTLFSQKKEHDEELILTKDRMLLIFAHELKTPLNAIINFAGHINRGLQKNITRKKIDKYIELSEIIKVNGEILLSEITTLLDISKIKEQKMNFSIEKIVLNDILDHIIYKYKLLYNKNVLSNIEKIEMMGDKSSFIHIFENLYSNALKYSKEKVNISLTQDKENFYITIEDDGIGIKYNEYKKVFELFEQTEETVLDREKEGTGVGLYIVKLLCDKFKYNIEISTSVLGGAKFCISGKKDNI
ncbi:MAG: hypothetical protein DRG78_02155 [Epsilonproteobacteria bacterium]|nr:MAG: hypothetical protein DRG78_02155 [Campylobacterota bacterium]